MRLLWSWPISRNWSLPIKIWLLRSPVSDLQRGPELIRATETFKVMRAGLMKHLRPQTPFTPSLYWRDAERSFDCRSRAPEDRGRRPQSEP
jgi:hypothetical protein